MMDSARIDPELSRWLRWASERGSTPMFVHTFGRRCAHRLLGGLPLLRSAALQISAGILRTRESIEEARLRLEPSKVKEPLSQLFTSSV